MGSSFVEEVDVLVVGGGLAGLGCAGCECFGVKKANDKGKSILVLEAHGRLGGRVQPVRGGAFDKLLPGMEIDLGAEFIHGDGHCLYEYAQEEGWVLRQNFIWAHGDGGPNEEAAPDGGAGYYYVGGTERKLYRFDALDEQLEHLRDELDALSEKGAPEETHSWTLEKYLESRGVSPRAMAMANAGYGNTLGASIGELHVGLTCRLEKLWVENDGSERDYRIWPSTRLLLERLERRAAENLAEIRTGCRVISVEDQGGSILVKYVSDSSRTFLVRARHCVVTVPLAILQGKGISENEVINFVPSLPLDKRDAISKLCVRGAMKIVAKFDHAFWPKDFHGAICSDCTIPEFWAKDVGQFSDAFGNVLKEMVSPDRGYVCLVGYAMADFADHLSSLDEEQVLTIFLQQLDEIFRDRGNQVASRAFQGGFVHDWSKVLHIRGGYSFPGIHEESDSRALYARTEFGGKLLFAGEASDDQNAFMTMNCAITTGERAANRIIAATMEPNL